MHNDAFEKTVFLRKGRGVVRYWFTQHLPPHTATLIANTLACYTLGLLTHTTNHNTPPWLLLLIGTGISGALSTWSTLAKELGNLITENPRKATYYLTTTITLGILATHITQ